MDGSENERASSRMDRKVQARHDWISVDRRCCETDENGRMDHAHFPLFVGFLFDRWANVVQLGIRPAGKIDHLE
jgi:hypothetical protein